MGVEHVCCEDAEDLAFAPSSGWIIENRCCGYTKIVFCPWCGVKLPDEEFLKAEAAMDPEIKECFHL